MLIMKKISFKNTLLLGSKSPSRQMLLNLAQIPFTLIGQDADETLCDWALPLPEIVTHIARFKMEHVQLPAGFDGQVCFVLTADTLTQDKNGAVQGKPVDRDDAIAKIKSSRVGSNLCTAFCLDKKIWRNNQWQLIERIEQVVHAEYLFVLPDEWIDIYLDTSIAMDTAGAITVEAFGAQFLKVVNGSYSAIIGLPLFEVREALAKLGFFE
jgi:septum formation protein